MNILIVGTDANAAECRQKFGEEHVWTRVENRAEAKQKLPNTDVVFDFISAHESLNVYNDFSLPVFINTSFATLASFVTGGLQAKGSVAGFCGLPTFVNRPVLEVSILDMKNEPALMAICQALKTEYKTVSDRVGMVTPRVICMIINEAYFTVEEGTATKPDIDLAMKLGTNYPHGPFEWATKIGLKQVVNLLKAVHADTHHERYEVCPSLQQAALEEK